MQNSPHHDPVFVQRNFGTNLLFETVSVWLLCAARRREIIRLVTGMGVLFQSVATCVRPLFAGCLSKPVVAIVSFVRVELPSSGAFVHGQPFLFLLALLSSAIWPTSRPGAQCATVALQDLQVLKCGGSSKILPLRIIVVSRRCNCTYHLARLRFQDEEKIRWKGDSKQVCSEAKTGSRSRLVFLVQVWSLRLCRWSGSREPVVEA